MNTSLRQYGYLFLMIGILFFGWSASSYAQNIDVSFHPDPLFSESNALPGDTSTPYATVMNETEESQEMYIGATNIVDGDGLGSVIDLSIKEDNVELWSGTFRELFDAGQVPLSLLGAGESTQYDFTARFQEGTGNEYQTGVLSFDIWIGFDGALSQGIGGGASNEEVLTASSGGSGGPSFGSSASTHNLLIFNERVTDVVVDGVQDSLNTWTVMISWNTNIPATSQVIYGPVFGGPYSLDLDLLNFGYPFGTAKKDIIPKVTDHTVVLSGLAPGDYVYRVVSEASPPTISFEHEFTLDEFEDGIGGGQDIFLSSGGSTIDSPTGSVLGSFVVAPSANNTFGSDVDGAVLDAHDSSVIENLEAERDNTKTILLSDIEGAQAQSSSEDTDEDCMLYLLAILLAIFILTLLYDWSAGRRHLRREQLVRRRLSIALLLTFTAIILLLIIGYVCPIIYLVILFVILGLSALSHSRWDRKGGNSPKKIIRRRIR